MAQKMAPARVSGKHGHGIALFVEDSRGDLVDIEYLCTDCARDADDPAIYTADLWPVFDFGDSGAYCKRCERRIG